MKRGRKKSVLKAKKSSCGKIYHKRRKTTHKSKKSLLDKILSW